MFWRCLVDITGSKQDAMTVICDCSDRVLSFTKTANFLIQLNNYPSPKEDLYKLHLFIVKVYLSQGYSVVQLSLTALYIWRFILCLSRPQQSHFQPLWVSILSNSGTTRTGHFLNKLTSLTYDNTWNRHILFCNLHPSTWCCTQVDTYSWFL